MTFTGFDTMAREHGATDTQQESDFYAAYWDKYAVSYSPETERASVVFASDFVPVDSGLSDIPLEQAVRVVADDLEPGEGYWSDRVS